MLTGFKRFTLSGFIWHKLDIEVHIEQMMLNHSFVTLIHLLTLTGAVTDTLCGMVLYLMKVNTPEG